MPTRYQPYPLLFNFSGRIDRTQFWLGTALYFALIFLLWGPVLRTAAYVFHLPDEITIWDSWRIAGFVAMMGATLVVTIWCAFAIGTKRLHDRGRRGTWMLVYLLPYWAHNAVTQGDFYRGTTAWPASITTGLWFVAMAFLLFGLVDLGLVPGARGGNRFGEDPHLPAPG